METPNTDGAAVKEEASQLSDRIDLQGSDVGSSFYSEKCDVCPANDGIVYNLTTRRHQLYCALQAHLLHGEVYDAARTYQAVRDTFNGNPGCSPCLGGKGMEAFGSELEEHDCI